MVFIICMIQAWFFHQYIRSKLLCSSVLYSIYYTQWNIKSCIFIFRKPLSMFQKIISTLNSPSFIYANDTKHEIIAAYNSAQTNFFYQEQCFKVKETSTIQLFRKIGWKHFYKTKSNPKLKTFHSNGKTVFADGPQVPGLAKGNGQLSRNVLWYLLTWSNWHSIFPRQAR